MSTPTGPLTLAEKVWNDHLVAKGASLDVYLEELRFLSKRHQCEAVLTRRLAESKYLNP